MSAKIIPCAKCGEDIKVTDTSSLYKPDGEPYKIYCGPCSTPVDLKLEARLESVKELVILTHLQAATIHAETRLLDLINAVENVRNVENRLNEWV